MPTKLGHDPVSIGPQIKSTYTRTHMNLVVLTPKVATKSHTPLVKSLNCHIFVNGIVKSKLNSTTELAVSRFGWTFYILMRMIKAYLLNVTED